MISKVTNFKNSGSAVGYVRDLTIFMAIQIAIAIVVWRYGSAAGSQHYLAAFQDKLHRLESTKGSRLIFVGGSNLAFGIHGALVHSTTGRSPVNLGLYAPLGLKYQLEMVRQFGQPGDLVIIAPEFEMFDAALEPDSPSSVEELLRLNDGATAFFDRNESTGWKRFFDVTSLQLAHQYAGRACDAIARSSRERLYARENFNHFGDMVGHQSKPPKERIQIHGVDLGNQEAINLSIDRLNDFAGECRHCGIEVFWTLPPIPAQRYELYAHQINAFEATMVRRLEIRQLQSAQESIYPISAFHDSVYHLSFDQAAIRTIAWMESIQRTAGRAELSIQR